MGDRGRTRLVHFGGVGGLKWETAPQRYKFYARSLIPRVISMCYVNWSLDQIVVLLWVSSGNG